MLNHARIAVFALIAAQGLCLAQDKSEQKEKRIWGTTYFRTVEKSQPFVIDDISQGEHLLGSGVLERERKGGPQLLIQGHLNEIGEFTPNVSLAVSDQDDGGWKIIESSLTAKIDVTLTAAPHIDRLFIRIQLDAFQPYIGKFKFCQVSLQTGETDVFPMEWLKDPQNK